VTIVVRPARPEDLDGIVEIGLVAWREGYRGVVPDDVMPDAGALRTRMSERVDQRSRHIAVGELDTVVRGWITFGPSRDLGAAPSVGEIWALNVHPDDWRRGIGRQLVGYALERLGHGSFDEVTLWTFRDTPRSRSFYEALGFRADGAMQRRHASGGVTEVRYRITLSPAASR
jgi:ribosomal protein S18 acetylase RimI-like enzyme